MCRLSLSVPLLATVLVPLSLLPAAAGAADSVRKVAPFIAINSKGPISITVNVGQPQSVTVSGSDDFVSQLRTEVVQNELNLTLPERHGGQVSGNPHVTINLPSLSRVKVEGAGETILNRVAGERIDISYLGAGHLVANGKVKLLRLAAKGVGEVDTHALQAERVDVNFKGVGAVSVYAHDTLNAIARGMGSLSYYGHPRVINKSVQGLGSVSAGD
ncbi:MAG TPA: DUF2807 domain-containing protein [Burkholderiaceae bacterium]|nr:DUF2807 domain-containing protein [Burkholderiaceae bacterium]